MGELTGAALPPRAASGSPTIHIGALAQHIDREVGRPWAKPVPDRKPRHPGRVIDYPLSDAGRLRSAFAQALRELRAYRTGEVILMRAWRAYACGPDSTPKGEREQLAP
jgi:hypothetical protein